jgi:hypothetical protein
LDGIQDRQIQIVARIATLYRFGAHIVGARRKRHWNSAGGLPMNCDLSGS